LSIISARRNLRLRAAGISETVSSNVTAKEFSSLLFLMAVIAERKELVAHFSEQLSTGGPMRIVAACAVKTHLFAVHQKLLLALKRMAGPADA